MARTYINRQSIQSIMKTVENGELLSNNYNYNLDLAFVPDENVDDLTDHSESGSEYEEVDGVVGGSYEVFYDKYDSDQKLLEPEHDYKWIDGEYKRNTDCDKEKIFLTEEQKFSISKMSFVELFELFFSKKLKTYIIESTLENGYELSIDKLDVFLGICITSSINSRKRDRDYWSKDPLLHLDMIASSISRNEYLSIKRFMKFSKTADKNLHDKIWRVRAISEIFRENIQKFGFFASNLSIDESMIKFFGRCKMKQFMRNKPIRFGLKLWAICSVSGYMFDFDIYCGKHEVQESEKLNSCNLGTKVVMKMLHHLLSSVPKNKLAEYHVCFDNFFSSPDLLVHLQNLGLKATATVRQNRVYEMKEEEEKGKKGKKTKLVRKQVEIFLKNDSSRGDYSVKHDQKGKINYILVKDTKQVSFLSTAAGVTPLEPVRRYSSNHEYRIAMPYPKAFDIYNNSMGGVDLQDQHCSDLKLKNRSKKWTRAFFLRVIEASITNALVLWNLCVEKKDRRGTYHFAKEIARFYLQKEITKKFPTHTIITIPLSRQCSVCKKKDLLIVLSARNIFVLTVSGMSTI